MKKMLALLTLVMLAAAFVIVPAGASLIPMSWGFPVMVQNSSLTGFQTQSATAHDIESANIAFPTSGVTSSLFGSSFPTIGQDSDQGTSQTALAFQQQTQSSYFAYPFISIGGSPVPSLGLL